MAYTLYQLGPNNESTYAECWGTTATSPGREITRGKSLADLVDAVSALDHDNWWIRGPGGVNVAGNRQDFFALPRIKNLLKWAKDKRAEIV